MSASTRLLLGLALEVATLAAAPATHARTFQTLYTFTGGADGASPQGDLVLKDGMLYGVTSGKSSISPSSCNGAGGCGTVFKLDPTTRKLTTLHNFSGGADGAHPFAGVVFDTTGVLYGTTEGGGSGCNGGGCGTVFKLDPTTQTLTTLHNFTGGVDGAFPFAGVVFDTTGTLYGTTAQGGGSGRTGECCGTVFKLDPITKTLTTLHNFTGGVDGAFPRARLLFDTTGMLYGTTSGHGLGSGTVFQLDPTTETLTTLHKFGGGSSGGYPEAGLTFEEGRRFLFGTTTYFGSPCGSIVGCGTVFRLNPAIEHLVTLHAFTGGADGETPFADLALNNGKLYGTTFRGMSNCGTVFNLISSTKTLRTLHVFTCGADGASPEGGIVFDTTGALYGSTGFGGNNGGICIREGNFGCGTVFKLVP